MALEAFARAGVDPLSAALRSELAGFALAIAFSPLHLGLLLLLLLGPRPLRRGSLLLLAWLITSALAVAVPLSLGHGLLLSMEKGSTHRTGLDLLAAGALLALGLNTLVNRGEAGEAPAWTRRLDSFCSLPIPLLLGLSCALQVVSPEDLFLYTKTAGGLLASGMGRMAEALATVLFSLLSGCLLMLPLLAVLLLGQERVQPVLEGSRQWLYRNGEPLMAAMSLALALYLGWQGIEGLVAG